MGWTSCRMFSRLILLAYLQIGEPLFQAVDLGDEQRKQLDLLLAQGVYALEHVGHIIQQSFKEGLVDLLHSCVDLHGMA